MDDERHDVSPVYGEYRVGARIFLIRSKADADETDSMPDFPHFDLPEYDEEGRPYAFACNEGCEFFDDGSRNPGARLCCDCIYMQGDPIGICACEMKKEKEGDQ